MEQQQCPICMLYLLPGMNLQDHLDTHPKDMIIKALLSAKTEPPKPAVSNETAATVFLTTSAPFNTPQAHIYQEQQQNHHQPIQNNFALAKRHTSNNNNTVLFNNRPYRLTLDAPQTVSTPTSTTFLNSNSNYSARTPNNDGDLFDNNKTAAFRCIQNTEQKNIMIVNTSSTQFIQQTLPVKKPATTTAIELHPVIIDNSGMPINANSVPNAISIIPRYTSEKYSGPPPSYSTAISSVTNTINDKPRVIDLTQTPTISTMKMMEKHAGNKNHGKMTTLSSNGGEDNRQMLIRGPQKFLEYTQTENGDFMITEKLMSSHHQPSTSRGLNVSHEEEIIEEVQGENGSEYSIKYVDIDNQMTFDITEGDEDGKFQDGQQYVIEESVETQEIEQDDVEIIESDKEVSFEAGPAKNNGVKVLSDVKLSSARVVSPSIKDIIQQYNNQTENEKKDEEEAKETPVNDVNLSSKADAQQDEEVDHFSLIKCTETLNLSKDKDESTSACTSVIRKTTIEAEPACSTAPAPETIQKDEPQPSTSGCVRKSNVVFNSNPNRLKIKQPKKLVVKLKKPLLNLDEVPSSSTEPAPQYPIALNEVSIKSEVMCDDAVIITEKAPEAEEENVNEAEEVSCKMETDHKEFDTTFLDQHDYEHVSRIEVTPEIHHDSDTNQSLMSMDLEPENHVVKREQIDDDFPIVIKTEMNTCTSSSSASALSQSSCSNSSPGPSRLTIESVASVNESSPLNFLYQNDRVRFSPPLSPYVYLKTFSSTQSDDHPKQEADISWNGSNSLAIQNSDQNSTSSRYTPSFDDNRSNYTDLDGGNNKTNSSVGDGHIRAPSTDSLNIRTDEKMPARGEISEQESNGEIEQPWHHPYFQLQAYPSSYDMSTAQECWNLSKADSQNACDSNNIQNVIINFPPLNAQNEDIKTPDLLKTIMQTVTKQEPTGIDDEASGSNSNLIAKRNRTFRCPECSKFFVKLKARNRHIEQVHPHLRRAKKSKIAPTSTQTSKSETSVFASSSSALVNWSATTTSQEQEVKVLNIKNEPSTSAAVLVKNEMNRMLISTTGSIKMEMDRLLLEPSTSSTSQLSTLGLKIKRTYMCAKCNEQFRTLKLLDKHFQIHPAECTLCQKTFNSWNTFSLHLKHHLNIRVHACRFCPKRFVQRQRLVEHERVHTGSMPIKCPHCDERFRRYSNMLHHRARVHLNKKAKQEDFVCDCGEIFQTKAKLEWHQETHENKPKPCPYCRERFTHRNSLTRHIRLSHTDKYVFAKSKAVSCPICNSTYLPSSIKAHMATHQISNKEYSCSICSKQFSTKWNLKQHHWTHANRSTKPFQCNVCPSAFVRETDYTTHMNAHRSIKPFTCNTCGKRFVRKYNWLRHSREHEREKKFVCETCNKKFHRAYYLTEHKRVHTGERPFSCTICGKTSATKTNHNKHIKIHHARDPLTAEG